MHARRFDLVASAERAFNYFVGHIDRRTGCPFIWTYLLTDPPKLAHDGWDTVEDVGRFIEALVLLRLMTGSDAGLATELALRDRLVAQQNPDDGLIYRPDLPYTTPVADVYDQMSALHGLVARFLADADPVCGRAIDACLDALSGLAAWDGADYARFNCVAVHNGRALAAYDGQLTETDNPETPDEAWFGRVIRPAFRYAVATGKEQPLVLARAVARDVAFRSDRYGDDGSFSRERHDDGSVWTNGHFHSRANTLAAILRLAAHTGDDDLVAWGERVFRWALGRGTAFGWYPEFIGRRDVAVEGCETCGVVDMLDAAITLARLGRDDCWGVADRIWRNQLLENQLRDVSWVRTTRTRDDTETECFDRAAERALGGFAGWAGPNDLISNFSDPHFSALDPTQDHRRTLMGCCSGSGAKGLYLAWHESLRPTDDGIAVNFAVTRDSDRAGLRCFEPGEGRIELTMKVAGTAEVRLPGSPDEREVSVERCGETVSTEWRRGRVRLVGLNVGDRVVVRYPLKEYTETVTVGGWDRTTPVDYELTWRGNTVVDVAPAGKRCPLYRRRAAAEGDPDGEPRVGPVGTGAYDY